MSGWTKIFVLIAALALIFAVHEKNSRIAKQPGGYAVINFPALLAEFPEYKVINDFRQELDDLESGDKRISSLAYTEKYFALEKEKSLLLDVSAMGDGVFNNLAETAYMNKLDREFFEIKSDFNEQRNQLFKGSKSSLDDIYRKASSLRPERGYEQEKRRLFNLRLKIAVLNNDMYVMSELRTATIKEEIDSIETVLKQAENAYTARVTEQFRSGSEEVRATLDKKLTELEFELQNELYAALSTSEGALHNSTAEGREKGMDAIAESMTARRKIAAGIGAVQGTAGSENPLNVIKDLETEISNEYRRRLSRKAPAIAERGGIGTILATKYAGLSKAPDITNQFVF